MALALVALGGAAGAAARYLVDGWVTQRVVGAFPFGTLVVNMSGSLVVGVLFALAIERDVVPAGIRAPVMIGFIGAYTTFSTLVLDSWRLWEGGAVTLALLNLVGSSVLGIVAVVIGLSLGRAVG